jgi:hypothetical protein
MKYNLEGLSSILGKHLLILLRNHNVQKCNFLQINFVRRTVQSTEQQTRCNRRWDAARRTTGPYGILKLELLEMGKKFQG